MAPTHSSKSPDPIEADRAEVKRAADDPAHPWHAGVNVFIGAYAISDENARTFMRAIAPYMFDENGDLDI